MKQQKTKDIGGMFIYHDNKNRTIYSNPLQKKGYLIDNDSLKKYVILNNGWVFAIAIGAFLNYIFDISVKVCLIIGIIVFVSFTALFYLWLLPSLNTIENYQKPKNISFITRVEEKQSAKRLLITFVLGVIMSIMIFFYSKNSNYSTFNVMANYVVALIMFVYSLIFLIAFIKKISSKK